MRRMTSVALVSLLAGLFVAGCAGQPSTNTGSSTLPDPAGSPQVATTVTYERQGGIAGFHDELVVQPDGSYTFAGRHRSPGTEKLSAAELSELHRLLRSVDFATVPTYSPLRIADGFDHVIRYGGHEVHAGDGNIPSTLQPVIDLLGGILRRHGA
jgi:hypothetical protein